MCGFAGFTGYLENGKDVLTNMMNRIVHRGPDSAGRSEEHTSELQSHA